MQIAFDDQELSAIGDPGLMPRFARGIVNAKALAFAAVDALVVLVNNAAFENATDPDAGVFCGRDDVEGVPIPIQKSNSRYLEAPQGADVFDLAPREIRESGISLAMKTTKREQAEFYLLNVGVHYLDRISEEFLLLVAVSRVAPRE